MARGKPLGLMALGHVSLLALRLCDRQRNPAHGRLTSKASQVAAAYSLPSGLAKAVPHSGEQDEGDAGLRQFVRSAVPLAAQNPYVRPPAPNGHLLGGAVLAILFRGVVKGPAPRDAVVSFREDTTPGVIQPWLVGW
jgi:hypothetical protein